MDENLIPQPDEAELERRRALRDRRTHDLVELMTRRRELSASTRGPTP